MATSERYFETALKFNATVPFLLATLAARRWSTPPGRARSSTSPPARLTWSMTAMAAYGAGKAALNRMTQDLAAELAPQVRVNTIGVGGVGTRPASRWC